ncbi:conserved hypothetical protein [Vibrio nigripulchritudo SO65]|nr:conserved hypothetical protein [Vibrio nigripulchritudo FTn2]CCN67352.1 conserved hypothetical protein [Vibrio nigripulchritudo POn4]CCN74285.1 conserved hypothetical protein [Vibrio nigripulchritudo SO65]
MRCSRKEAGRLLEPVSDCWPRRMATAAKAEQNPAYMSTPPILNPSLLYRVMMGFLLFTDAFQMIPTKLGETIVLILTKTD